MRQSGKRQTHPTEGGHPVFTYRPPKYLVAGRWAALGVGAVSLVCALYVAFWFFMAGQVRDGIMAWIDERRNEGLEVNFKQLDIGGFPFRLRVTIDGPSIAAPKSQMRWGWEGERVSASMRPWRPRRVAIDGPGNHAFVFSRNGEIQHFHGQAEHLSAAMTFGGAWPTPLEADIIGLVVKGSQKGDVWNVGRAHVDAVVPPKNEGSPVLEARLRLGDLSVPRRLNLPLGPDIERLEISANIIRPLIGKPFKTALSNWRDDGGTIALPRLSVAYGPLSMSADGTMALDGAMQPIGSFTAHIEGFFETVDALRKRSIIQPRDAVTAKIVLGVMSRRSANGRASLNVPITVQERRLFAGPVPLAEIPEIFW